MKRPALQKRTLALVAVLAPLLVLFVYVAMRSGPLAPVPVVLGTVEEMGLSPALFGIGNVEARYTYRIGPTVAGRVKTVEVQVGDHVVAGQLLGEMDPVDMDERLRVQDAAMNRAQAQFEEAQARKDYAYSQLQRYVQLLQARTTSEEIVSTRRQELQIAEAGLTAAREELTRVRAEREVLTAQRDNLRLVAPADGLVVARGAEPGSTVVAGQAVVELIDPASLWVNVRFDQVRARGLTTGLPARITLRSRADAVQAGRVLRVEPLADAVTEETLAKVVFEQLPQPLPPVGELAEVTVELPALPVGPVIPNAAIQRIDGRIGVWQVMGDELFFRPVRLGISDLEGQVLVLDGVAAGDRVVVYSAMALDEHSRIHSVERLPGVSP